MARGRAPGYDEQREQILAHAARLFAQRGYPATSMNEVAQACGLSKPSLYHYFRDKYDLLVQIAEGHVSRLEALVVDVHLRSLAPEPALRELIHHLVHAYAGAQDAHRVLTEDVKFLKPEDRARVLDRERRIVEGFGQALATLRPELRRESMTTPLTMLLFGMVNWMFTWLHPEGRLTHADMAPIVADLFLGGVGAVHVPAAATAPAVLAALDPPAPLGGGR
jgi:TetR/AcrR family transcriptional regulator